MTRVCCGVLDAYLEPFGGLGRRAELLRWVALARSTGCVSRALSTESAFQEAPATVVAGEEFPVRGLVPGATEAVDRRRVASASQSPRVSVAGGRLD
jgi:hypothetical protein